MGLLEARIARLVTQRLPQMALAAMRQVEQRLLVEPDQRRFQQAGEVEVVLRQQDEARQRKQILDRQFLAEIEPIDARHIDAGALQLADQGMHERIAPAHQHHEVAGMQKLARAGQPLVANQAFGMEGNQLGQPLVRCRQRAGLAGFRPIAGRIGLALLRRHHRPELDAAGLADAARQMPDLFALGRHAAGCRVGGENPIDRIEHGCGRAEGDV